tara:strand:+ start:427 stop:1008 length:582 start_codon:yes stop_codon:yes gene_type:complete
MAIIYTYPTVIPQADDILLGTEKDASLRNPTKNFLISDIAKVIISTFNGTSKVIPVFLDVTDPSTGKVNSELRDSIISQDAVPGGTQITITGTLQVTGPIKDSAGNTGNNGQVLSSTGAGTSWIDAPGAGTGVFPNIAATVWTITHNGTWGPYPAVTVVNNNDIEQIGEVEYLSNTQLQITFSASFAGTAYLN